MLTYIDNLEEETKRRWIRILAAVNVVAWSLAILLIHGNWVSGNLNGVTPTPSQIPTTPAPVGTTEPERPSTIIDEQQAPIWIDSDPPPSPQLTPSPSPDTVIPTPTASPSPSDDPSPEPTETPGPEPTDSAQPTGPPTDTE